MKGHALVRDGVQGGEERGAVGMFRPFLVYPCVLSSTSCTTRCAIERRGRARVRIALWARFLGERVLGPASVSACFCSGRVWRPASRARSFRGAVCALRQAHTIGREERRRRDSQSVWERPYRRPLLPHRPQRTAQGDDRRRSSSGGRCASCVLSLA